MKFLPEVQSVDEWKSRLNIAFIKRCASKLSKRKRSYLHRVLDHGVEPPPVLQTDRGVNSSHFQDPESWIINLYKNDPEGYQQVMKDRLNALTYGALAGPIVGGLKGKVFGKSPIVQPEFLLPQKDKVRVIKNLSKIPKMPKSTQKAALNEGNNLSYNSSYTSKETGCSFPGLKDKATLIASCPSGYMLLDDLAGYYYQFSSHKSTVHMKVVVLWFPGLPKPLYYVMMSAVFGESAAPAAAMGLHLGVLEAFECVSPEGIYKMGTWTHPEAYGLVTESKKWTDLVFKKPSKSNKHPWLHTQGENWARWKTGHSARSYFVHIDDVAWIARDNRSVHHLRNHTRKLYGKANLKTSPKVSDIASQVMEVTGSLLDSVGQQIGFTQEKWDKFDRSIESIRDSYKVKVELGLLYKVAGYANFIASTFPTLRAFMTSFSRFLGNVAQVAKSDRKLWALLKLEKILVPKALLDMMIQGYKHAIALRWTPAVYFLASEADAQSIHSTDACALGKDHPPGLGAIDHLIGDHCSVMLDPSHPFYERRIEFLEQLIFLLWLDVKTLHRIELKKRLLRKNKSLPPLLLKFYQDNERVKFNIIAFKARDQQLSTLIPIGSLTRDRHLILFPVRANTHEIVADPLSRNEDWETRRLAWTKERIPRSKTVTPIRLGYWTDVILRLENQYRSNLL